MSLPIDLVLIRHGQSEANAAKLLYDNGDTSAFIKLIEGRHTRSYRLSKRGCEEARLAGEWLKYEFFANDEIFDGFFVSEYTRAMETAALLDLPGALWHRSIYLTERDWGDMETSPENERRNRFQDALNMRVIEPFFWRPPNGESFADLCLRLDYVINHLNKEWGNKRVIVVCHGEVIRAFRILIEGMSQKEFKRIYLSTEEEAKVNNCEIIHYTRKNPETREIESQTDWLRRIRPCDTPIWYSGWEKISRSNCTNNDILNIVNEIPRIIE